MWNDASTLGYKELTINLKSLKKKNEIYWEGAAAAAKSLQSCPTLCDPRDGSPPGSPIPGILQARTLQVGCHFLLQCTKVKSESEVAQSCPTLSDPVDCSLPGSSIHGIFQARVLEWGAIALRDECNCAVVWAFFGIAFLWDWNENWYFSVLWPLLSFLNLLTYWMQKI